MPWFLIIMLGIFNGIWRLVKVVIKPIFEFLYYVILDIFKGMGIGEKAAKALVSVIIIIVILMLLH